MPTYTMVTRAPSERVRAAVSDGRTGGYVIDEVQGTTVLFDPPIRVRQVTGARLILPARPVVDAIGTPAWVLLANQDVAEACLMAPGHPPQWLTWDGNRSPGGLGTAEEERVAWSASCHRAAACYGEPDRGPALALVRHDPTSGGPAAPVDDLLRQLCRIFRLPEVGVGRSLLAHDDPGVPGALRVEPAGSAGVLGRLFCRAR